ncbi:MAG: DUF6713 family protein [Longimicrobiales bacterium]
MIPKSLRWLYVVNLALAAAHQVEATHWGEWGLLGIPVGVQGFVVLTFLIFLFFLHGLVQLVRENRAGLWYSGVLAGGGLLSTACHVYFLARGDGGFTHPVALLVLAGVGAVSLVQAVVTVRALPGAPDEPQAPEPDFVPE